MDNSFKHNNPFVGLRAFNEDENHLFFGRTVQVNYLLKKISSNRFVAVIGSSECGKSSLIKAGVIPAIYSGILSGANWRAAIVNPGTNPIRNLAEGLAKNNVLYKRKANENISYEAIIESTLRRSGDGLVQVYKQAILPKKDNLLIVVDQFEELFRFNKYEKETNNGQSDAIAYLNLLLNASVQLEHPVHIIISMRSDFIGDCVQFRGLAEAVNAGQYLVPRQTRDEIRDAITGPVSVGGAQIAPELIIRLLNDAADYIDPQPILQHALMRTWDAWADRNKSIDQISIEDYELIGGMSNGITQHAEEAYSELTTDKQRTICELMFKALTDETDLKSSKRLPASVSDLCALTNPGKVTDEHLRIDIDDAWQDLFKPFIEGKPQQHDELLIAANCLLEIYFQSGIYKLSEILEDAVKNPDEIGRGVQMLQTQLQRLYHQNLTEGEKKRLPAKLSEVFSAIKHAYLSYQSIVAADEINKMESVEQVRQIKIADYVKKAETKTPGNPPKLRVEIERVVNKLSATEIDDKSETRIVRTAAATTVLGLYFKSNIYKLTEIIEDATQKLGKKVISFFDVIKQQYISYQSNASYKELSKMETADVVRKIKIEEILNKQNQEVIDVVEVFRKPNRYFLMPADVELNGDSVIDLSYDCLINKWERLNKWTSDELKNAEIYMRLSEAAKEYEKDKQPGNLWQNPKLAYGLKWFDDEKNNRNATWGKRKDTNYTQAINFLLKSREADANRKKRKIAEWILYAVLLAILLSGGSFWLGNKGVPVRIKIFASDDKLNSALDISSDLFNKEGSIWKYTDTKVKTPENTSVKQPEKIVTPITDSPPPPSHPVPPAPVTVTIHDITPNTIHDTKIIKEPMAKNIALDEYLKRIRDEQPVDSLVLAYCYHIDTLRADVKNDFPDYREDIPKNNSELYKALYEVFKNSRKPEFQNYFKDDIYGESYQVRQDQISPDRILKNNSDVYISPDGFDLILKNKGQQVDVERRSNKWKSFATDHDSTVFCSTEDNLLVIYFVNENHFKQYKTITLGVNPGTALFYDNNSNKLYVGLKSGRFGFINMKDKKEQLDFHKYTETPDKQAITAIQPFERNTKNYLLVTMFNSKAIVYCLPPNTNETKSALKGNELSERISIKSARYFKEKNRVYLLTDQGKIFEWNPFEDVLFKELQNLININSDSYLKLRDSQKVKIY